MFEHQFKKSGGLI